MDIEKAYWVLKGSNGKFDESVLLKIMSPPLPEDLCRSKSWMCIHMYMYSTLCSCTCTCVYNVCSNTCVCIHVFLYILNWFIFAINLFWFCD